MATKNLRYLGLGIATAVALGTTCFSLRAADDIIRTRRGWIRIESAPVVEQPIARDNRPRTIERTVTFLLGAPIRAQGGEVIGRVEDLVLGDDGQVEYLFASFNGVPGLGFKLVAIPWTSAGVERQRRAVHLEMSRDQLTQAPSFSRNALPDVTDPHWIDMIDAFWRNSPAVHEPAPGARADQERDRTGRRDIERAASRDDRAYDRPEPRSRGAHPEPAERENPQSSPPRD